MAIWAVLAPVISAVGGIVKSVFTTKGKAIDAMSTAIGGAVSVIQQADATDSQYASATAQVMAAIQEHGNWLEKSWRPALAVLCMAIIYSYWFHGYTPPYFNEPMSPMMAEIFVLIKICLCGYIPARSMDKWFASYQMRKLAELVLNQLMAKR